MNSRQRGFQPGVRLRGHGFDVRAGGQLAEGSSAANSFAELQVKSTPIFGRTFNLALSDHRPPTTFMQEQPTWRIWPLLLVALALQTTWLARLTFWGVHLDLPLLTTVSVALLLGWRFGAAYGLAAGLLTGIFAGRNLGSFAVSAMAAGGAFGFFDKGFSRDNPLAPPLCAAGTVVLAGMVFLLMSPTDFSLAWWLHQTLVRAALHAVLIWPLHLVIMRWVLPPARRMFV